MSVYAGAYDDPDPDRKDFDDDSHLSKNGEPPTMEQEKRMRREIANSNERRRMQSINNGFQSLRGLLPHHEGEKLSKAAILQQTAEYIYSLEQEKTRLLSQNCQLKRLVNQHEGGELPPKKRKTEILQVDSSDEGLGSMSPEPVTIQQTSTVIENAEMKRQYERERNLRLVLEEQVRQLESQLYQQQQQIEAQIYPIVDEEDLINLQVVSAESVPPVGHTQTVCCSPSRTRSPSPQPQPERLPSVLEAAIKAEPKVEVERLPSPAQAPAAAPSGDESGRLYVSNTSRQNLETIVEAIRHLEGDHLFGDEPQQQQQVQIVQATVVEQEVPLALTKSKPTDVSIKQEMSGFLDFKQQQQQRPGVIVVKQTS